jgi:hypothetical protein
VPVGVGGCLVELLRESLMLGSCGVEVGFGPFGADAERGPCFLKRGDTGVGRGAVLVAFASFMASWSASPCRVGADQPQKLRGKSLSQAFTMAAAVFNRQQNRRNLSRFILIIVSRRRHGRQSGLRIFLEYLLSLRRQRASLAEVGAH